MTCLVPVVRLVMALVLILNKWSTSSLGRSKICYFGQFMKLRYLGSNVTESYTFARAFLVELSNDEWS